MFQTELLDKFTTEEKYAVDMLSQTQNQPEDSRIGFRHATFTWSNDVDGSLTPSRRSFTLRIEEELSFTRDQISLIVGPTGSGKTSLLMALLGVLIALLPLPPL